MSNIDSAALSQSRSAISEPPAAGCCGGPAPQGADACCRRDAEVKATGGEGCGCGTAEPIPAPPVRSRTGCC